MNSVLEVHSEQDPRRCTRCILPETVPGLSFDSEGVCSVCGAHAAAPVLGEARLKEVLTAGKGPLYDCVVPVSGGKDSTYILYYAVKVLGLRVVAVNYDSGYQAGLAAENARRACEVLGVPLVVVKANPGVQIKMLREILRVSEILGIFFATCMNCEVNIRAAAINTARRYRVPYILYGSSKVEDIGNQSFLGMRSFFRELSISKVPALALHILKYCFYSVRQRIEMRVPGIHRYLPLGSLPLPKKGVRVVYFFDYAAWDSIAQIGLLREKLGWQQPAGQEQRFDCRLHCLGNYRWVQEAGVSCDGFTYANMVRAERMRRADAVAREEQTLSKVEQECVELLEEVGLHDYRLPQI